MTLYTIHVAAKPIPKPWRTIGMQWDMWHGCGEQGVWRVLEHGMLWHAVACMRPMVTPCCVVHVRPCMLHVCTAHSQAMALECHAEGHIS